MEVATVRRCGRLTLPVLIRKKLGLKEGDQFAMKPMTDMWLFLQ